MQLGEGKAFFLLSKAEFSAELARDLEGTYLNNLYDELKRPELQNVTECYICG
jgi:hypothetical protein